MGCDGTPDPRELRGFVSYAVNALEADDAEALFRVIDSRSRAAIYSIVEDQNASRALIEAHYPEEDKAEALRQLGPTFDTPEDFFAARCPAACRNSFRDNLGAPTNTEVIEGPGEMLEVTTSRGSLRVYREEPSAWWGLTWELETLSAERTRASRDRRQIEDNVTTFQRRERLETEEGELSE